MASTFRSQYVSPLARTFRPLKIWDSGDNGQREDDGEYEWTAKINGEDNNEDNVVFTVCPYFPSVHLLPQVFRPFVRLRRRPHFLVGEAYINWRNVPVAKRLESETAKRRNAPIPSPHNVGAVRSRSDQASVYGYVTPVSSR